MTKKINSLRRKSEFVFNLKMFIRALPYHCLVMGSVFVVSLIFNKFLEALCFLVSFFSLRYKFPTTYHSKSIVVCMTLTISIFTLSIVICPPIYVYALASIGAAYIDCLLLWLIQDRKECKEILKTYTDKNIWTMNEHKLRQYLYSCGVRDEKQEFVLMIVLQKLTFEECSKKMGYAESTLKEWSAYCKKKLKIKSWKQDKN